MLVNMMHYKEPFTRMKLRHEVWKKKYPDQPAGYGPAYGGISNARPETLNTRKPPANMDDLPFDPLEYIEHLDDLPFDPSADPDL